MADEKYYQLGTHTPEQWLELHAELIADGNTYEAVPTRPVILDDDKQHSPTRGSYLLTDEESAALKSDPRVRFINIDYSKYDEYKPPKDELQAVRPELVNRYSGTVKNYRIVGGLNTNDVNRTGYQLYRHQQFLDPWVDGGLADSAVPEVNIQQYATGKNIDLIVADEGMWIGHPEFQNNAVQSSDGTTPVENPRGYVGGNKLPGNGTCDVLDIALDGPYYIDPEWFDADAGNRLITRWDGTVVPTEAEARAWWGNGSNRSAKFANQGTVVLTTNYTRLNVLGDNTTRPRIAGADSEGEHGTPCGALSFGRTQGWAYNANKWNLDLYGTMGIGIEIGFDIQKLFHRMKPINPLYGTKDPTLSSNSWGYRADKDPGGDTYYYTHRATSNTSYTSETGIAWLSHMGTQGDAGRWKSQMKTNSLTTALDEMIDEGVIFVGAAGNSNQKVVKEGHPDYNNYITTLDGGNLEQSSFTEFGVEVTGTTNRTGFPQQGGKYINESGTTDYKTINIGALDDNYGTGSTERKVGYSDRGNQIDVFAAADGTLAANKTYSSVGDRPDTYSGFTYGTANDCTFSGTSAACPVAAGFLTTVLEQNRDWTWKELKEWTLNLNNQDASDFYFGVESTTPNDANWTDYPSLEGASPKVLYQAPWDERFKAGKRRVTNKLTIKGAVNFRYKK